MSTCK